MSDPNANIRKRQYRARQRAGVIVVGVEVSPEVVKALEDNLWLVKGREEDRDAISEALDELLEWWLAYFGPDATKRL